MELQSTEMRVSSKKSVKKVKSGERTGSSKTKKCQSSIPKWIRAGIFISCLGGFVLNCEKSVNEFLRETPTPTSTFERSEDKKLHLPAVTICSTGPFDYSNNGSIDPELQIEQLLHCHQPEDSDKPLKDCWQSVEGPGSNADITYVNFSDHKVLYTLHRGKCFTVESAVKVLPMSTLYMSLRSKPAILYIHEPGEEFYLHVSWHPIKFPPNILMSEETDWLDGYMEKTVVEEREDCKQWTFDEQIECMRRALRQKYLRSGLECTTAWLNSMLMPEPIAKAFCHTRADIKEVYDVVVRGAWGDALFNECRAPCRSVRYKLKAEEFVHNPNDVFLKSDDDVKEVYINYVTSAVKSTKTRPLFSINDIISAIGGSLNFFLGFSLISMLTHLSRIIKFPN